MPLFRFNAKARGIRSHQGLSDSQGHSTLFQAGPLKKVMFGRPNRAHNDIGPLLLLDTKHPNGLLNLIGIERTCLPNEPTKRIQDLCSLNIMDN